MPEEEEHSLKNGTILQNYEIIRVLGEGGFGITYLAKDIELGFEVVIKEYFPNEFSIRKNDSTIIAKGSSLKSFSRGMERFNEEAKILAKFNHPSIVKILSYFEANNTAYFVMEYEEGLDLSQYLKQQNSAVSQDEIFSIMMPILEGLKEVHNYKYLHRDIKPGNIVLRINNTPVLIDFGASKLVTGDVSKSITSMLTEGYAPLEQYSTDIKQQGPFTDIYAVAAVIYKMITGKVPPSAQTRSYQLLSDENDPYVSLMSLNLSAYDENFLKAIDRALAVKGKDRPQDIKEFQSDIAGLITHEKELEKTSVKEQTGIPDERSKIYKEAKRNNGLIVGLTVVGVALIAGVLFFLKDSGRETSSQLAFKDTAITHNVKHYKNKEEACAQGEAKECANLGVQYFQGKDKPQDYQKAMALFNKACDGSDAAGCFNLGSMYFNGVGGDKDHFKAVSFFKKACENNSAAGCNSLGFMHQKGQGTKRNHTHSAAAYEKACDLGHTGGCNNLGFMYENGNGVIKDNTKAFELYTKSCNADDAVGCINLAVMYEYGQGTIANKRKALEFYSKGCDAGNQEGCAHYKRLKK